MDSNVHLLTIGSKLMLKYSEKSHAQLLTCDSRLRVLFTKALENGYDHTILEGHRTKAMHDEYLRRGVTKVTYDKTKHSFLPSLAVDVAPCPINWEDSKAFYHFAGYIKGLAHTMGIKIRWGGDWDSDFDLNDQKFMDLVHFELIP